MKPIAAALPRNGENIERGKFGSAMPKTPANGFTIIAKVKPGRAARIREYAASVEKAVLSKAIRAQVKISVGTNQITDVTAEDLIEQAFNVSQGVTRLQALLIRWRSPIPPLISRLEAMVA